MWAAVVANGSCGEESCARIPSVWKSQTTPALDKPNLGVYRGLEERGTTRFSAMEHYGTFSLPRTAQAFFRPGYVYGQLPRSLEKRLVRVINLLRIDN